MYYIYISFLIILGCHQLFLKPASSLQLLQTLLQYVIEGITQIIWVGV
jgi:hypothetical protein